MDPDFDVSKLTPDAPTKDYNMLMNKTFRSDMVRRNTVWNAVSKYTLGLDDSHDPAGIFININGLNNAIHNTGGKIVTDPGKVSNFSELYRAFETADKIKNQNQWELLKGMVDKDIRDLLNQELTENKMINLKALFLESIIIEVLVGKRFIIDTPSNYYPALFSKNVKPGEEPWRITWFVASKTGELVPARHIQISNQEAGEIMHDNIPTSIVGKLSKYIPLVTGIKPDPFNLTKEARKDRSIHPENPGDWPEERSAKVQSLLRKLIPKKIAVKGGTEVSIDKGESDVAFDPKIEKS